MKTLSIFIVLICYVCFNFEFYVKTRGTKGEISTGKIYTKNQTRDTSDLGGNRGNGNYRSINNKNVISDKDALKAYKLTQPKKIVENVQRGFKTKNDGIL